MSIASTMTALANAVRTVTGTNEPLTVNDMLEKLQEHINNSVSSGTPNLWRGLALSSYEVPIGTTRIADNCPALMWQRSQLTSVTLPAGLLYIGNNVFQYSGITTINIPASVTHIGQNAFSASTALSSVVFAQGHKLGTIQDSAFSNTALTIVDIPASDPSIKKLEIGYGAFTHCPNLRRVSIDVSGKHIVLGNCAFQNEELLGASTDLITGGVYLTGTPASVVVGDATFRGCKNLTNCDTLLLSNCGLQAFSGSGLERVILSTPTYVDNIGNEAFSNCTSLRALSMASFLPKDKTIPPGLCRGCISLATTDLNASIQVIEANAFRDSGLTEFPMRPQSALTTIWTGAFQNTKITSLERLGEQSFLSAIHDFAFGYCTELRTVVFPDVPDLYVDKYAFYGCTNVDFRCKPGASFPAGYQTLWGATNSTLNGSSV